MAMAGKSLVRKGRTVFWISIALVCAAIGTTLLLANDMRNLKAALRHFDVAWPIDTPAQPDAPVRPAPAPKLQTTGRKPPEPAPPPVRLRANFYEPEKPEILGSFQRQVYVGGPELCALLNDAGFINAGWLTSRFNADIAACFSERKLAATNPEAQGSLFLSVKGSPDGSINAIRMKIFWLDNADGQTLKRELIEALRIVIQKTHWTDFLDAIEPIDKLEDFNVDGFGADLTFSKEDGGSDSHGFLLILSMDGQDPAQLRTRSYFDRKAWLHLPGHLTTPQE
ncbi:DUF6030 family protein [Rhizobiaceae bacterium n13]|uniref:DUF6030 family protein n=1 Tax=Ferirhizobium litorale TaxID=2927786 RepID=A0AAE3QE99_9HYPH|nr:DUF6030 family protein [Fererhizobium litorale]MDI7862316.1 DUF6030 family protein [Fererhizobium litorale]MDI7922410.1 DUF6030 family protein [Fererhizobium litorale]